MAGAGSRFEQAGYTFPKPLIEVHGKPMIQKVVENLNLNGRHIFIVQKDHYERYALQYLLPLISPGCEIVQVDGVTEGAACTTLLAEKFINNNTPLVIANSDQIIKYGIPISKIDGIDKTDGCVDGRLLVFESTHPKWSFVKVDNYLVTEVAEKRPISNIATCGVYYWARGSDYVKYAKQMIDKNIRVNNEFYIAPVYNEAIADNKKIGIRRVAEMWGLGTPEDLREYLTHYKG